VWSEFSGCFWSWSLSEGDGFDAAGSEGDVVLVATFVEHGVVCPAQRDGVFQIGVPTFGPRILMMNFELAPVTRTPVTAAWGSRKGVLVGNQFSQEFKDQIVELHRRRGRTFMDIAMEFNLSPTSVANWVRAAEKREAAPASSSVAVESDKARIARLEKELARKEEELVILGKALAFFARRQDQ